MALAISTMTRSYCRQTCLAQRIKEPVQDDSKNKYRLLARFQVLPRQRCVSEIADMELPVHRKTIFRSIPSRMCRRHWSPFDIVADHRDVRLALTTAKSCPCSWPYRWWQTTRSFSEIADRSSCAINKVTETWMQTSHPPKCKSYFKVFHKWHVWVSINKIKQWEDKTYRMERRLPSNTKIGTLIIREFAKTLP